MFISVISTNGFTTCKPLSKTELSTFPYNDLTPTFPAFICLNNEVEIPISNNAIPPYLKIVVYLDNGE